MKVGITLTARDIREEELDQKTAVVIDVLRATSVMITALANGAIWVKTAATIEEAVQSRSSGVLLGGERFALPIAGFDFSNSPLEFTPEKVAGNGIVLTTTNGTLAFSKCSKATEVLAGAFINHQAITEYLLLQNKSVQLVCAGTNGEFSMDDFLCAGMICSTLHEHGEVELDDLGRLAIMTWDQWGHDLHGALGKTTHYNVLKSKGLNHDLEYCLTSNRIDLVVRKNPETDQFEAVPKRK
jgi:2-phosphosulfolactate phosphatase